MKKTLTLLLMGLLFTCAAPAVVSNLPIDIRVVRQDQKVIRLIREIEGNGMFHPPFRLKTIAPSRGKQRCDAFVYCKDYDLVFVGGKNQVATFKATVIRKGKSARVVVER